MELNGRLLQVDESATKAILAGKSKNSLLIKECDAQPASNGVENAPVKVDPVLSESSRCKQEDFWRAWNSHREYLKRLSMIWMNVSAADAEDAFSEATIRAYEKYEFHASQISNERAWFARLLHNICIDKHRSNKRLKTLCERVREINTVDFSIFESTNLSPEGSLLNEELSGLLLTAIRELPDRLQKPVILRLVQGEDYDDIAKVLEITNDNARKRVQQGRSALRRKLLHIWSG
ncbi:RNA polymerase sigma factor [Sneathiella marina]|uniref:RNA polymerase sigma factor n=1 Tax=Sneathiella marina TaxID=2950108 RepID=A0ABY4WBC2_9PROT|nr:RNA polymerase sigma factor [Sneathiella marina]USG63070.1 RNA polymerase sigma factor [Sneathiella marina]